MEPRKNPKKDLRKKTSLFFNIGLVITLLLCITAFEWKFQETQVTVFSDFKGTDEWIPDVPPTIQPPKPKPVVIQNPVEVKDDDIIKNIPDVIADLTELEDWEPPVFDEPEPEVVEEPPMVIVEEMPSPQGGYEGFYKYLAKHIEYPRQAIRMDIQGKVFLSFVVEKDGRLSNIKVIRGIGSGCDEEAIRVLQACPAWHPGRQRYKPVRVRMVVPINFTLKH